MRFLKIRISQNSYYIMLVIHYTCNNFRCNEKKNCICFLGKYRKHIHRLFPSSHQMPNLAVLLSRFKPTSTTVRISIIRIASHDFNCTVAENCSYSLMLFEHSELCTTCNIYSTRCSMYPAR